MNAVNHRERASQVLPRRERLRAATEAEILATARALLVEGGLPALSLRELGRRMGMTASAVYRYYDGLPALLDALGALLFEELVSVLEAEVRPGRVQASPSLGHPDLDALMTASRVFRAWSIAHPTEFTFMFDCRERGPESRPNTAEGAGKFGRFFMQLFASGGDVPVKDEDGMLFAALPSPFDELFARSWVRLLGLVMVEVQGEYDHMIISPDRIFDLEMGEAGRMLLAAYEGAHSPVAAD